MKKHLLTFIFFGFMLALSAQTKAPSSFSGFSFGASLEAGYSGEKEYLFNEYNFNLGHSTFATTQERRPGYAAGLWLAYWLTPNWDVELGVNYGSWRAYAQIEGANYTLTEAVSSYSRERYTLRQNLLRIPVQSRVYFGRTDRRIRPFITLGAQAAYLAGQSNYLHQYYNNAGQEPVESSFAVQANLKAEWIDLERWRWSLLGGVGFQMDRARLSIQRNWPFNPVKYLEGDLLRYFPDYCSGNFGGDVWLYCNHQVSHLRQTSLRFEYRIF